MEEGILAIERSIHQKGGEGENPIRDQTLSKLYTLYAKALSNLSPIECYRLATDPHTLLIGIESYLKKNEKSSDICVDNAENSLRNAASLDATNTEAEKLIQAITGSPDTHVHERKPKEFVAQLFDSFADTFDEKLLQNLSYKVPKLVGTLAQKLLWEARKTHGQQQQTYSAILDAGCGTGLAGPYLRTLLHENTGVMIGVDASQKMLDKAAVCTINSGCGLETLNKDQTDHDKPLYEALLQMDLEDMSISNTLDIISHPSSTKAFDLIVAADVFVYFGSLDNILHTFASISTKEDNSNTLSTKLIFSCELATEKDAPLGWRLLPNGRFAHTKQHTVEAALKNGYQLIHYEEIVPRTEKGEPVRGHLFGFVYTGPNQNMINEL